MKNIVWSCKKFNALTNKELYEIFRIRIAVFIVEQNCPYQDADAKDLQCLHVIGTLSENPSEIIAYARIVPPAISYKEVSIGRVATSQKARRTGAGKLLMEKCLETVNHEFGKVPIRISAQAYLEKFYTGLGFKRVSENYLEDNIPHAEMLFVPR